MNNLRLAIVLLPFFLGACRAGKHLNSDDGKISIQFLQINDVYEIAPLENGKYGGIAKVAALKKIYQKKNPNTCLLMAGDFVSPSIYNSLKVDNVRVRGKQMIDALNSAGLNIATFGNHEFDISESELQDRINESNFEWITSNTFHRTKEGIVPFSKNGIAIPKTLIKQFRDADGTVARVGFIAVTLPFNKASFVSYNDAFQSAEEAYRAIKDSCDAVIALTHQLMEEDIALAKKVPGLIWICGGHEHDMRFSKTGDVFITKAHANAKSMYACELQIDKKNKKVSAYPELVMIDEKVEQDETVKKVVEKWMKVAESNFFSLGFNTSEILLTAGAPLDGRENIVRMQQTNLTQLVVKAMEFAATESNVAIVNAGSIRVDDMLNLPITQYDVLRTLPFGGSIREIDITGSLLISVLNAGQKNKGIGGYLHYSDAITLEDGKWLLNKKNILDNQIIRVAVTDFLLTGAEANLNFLTIKNPDIIKVYPEVKDSKDFRSDIRLAVVQYLKNKK